MKRGMEAITFCVVASVSVGALIYGLNALSNLIENADSKRKKGWGR